jgi:hypothetical protein
MGPSDRRGEETEEVKDSRPLTSVPPTLLVTRREETEEVKDSRLLTSVSPTLLVILDSVTHASLYMAPGYPVWAGGYLCVLPATTCLSSGSAAVKMALAD